MTVEAGSQQPITCHEAARLYAQHGYRVVPIAPGHKYPHLDAWQTAATSDLELIDAWYTGLYRDHGVGLLMGVPLGEVNPVAAGRMVEQRLQVDSEGRGDTETLGAEREDTDALGCQVALVPAATGIIFALDIDVGPGKHGDETLADLQDTYHDLPDTVQQQTGSGGFHLLYRAPPGVEIRNDAGKRLGPGLDIRGIGGQIVAAPSIHPNGQPYQWIWDSAPWEREVTDAPGWLIALLTREEQPEVARVPDQHVREERAGHHLEERERPGDRFNASTTWPTLLEADGWTQARDGHEGEQRWVRPGKGLREGISATVGYKGSDVLKVFTSSVPLLEQDRTYDRFGYWAATRHGGSVADAARALGASARQDDIRALVGTWKRDDPAEAGPSPNPGSAETGRGAHTQDTQPGLARWRIDWPTLWNKDHHEAEWTLEPLLAQGRGHALYATAKSGKSLLLLAISAALATGRPFLDQPAGPPRHVLYMDYEMNEADLVERLDSMGYGPDIDLDHLHYILLPTIGGLDTPDGARYVIEAADHWHPELAIIDTTARAVEGEENSADTFRAFYRHLGLTLKSRGVTYVRADHAGKDGEKGQRGSSAKNDDVDIVWWYQRTEDGATLYAKYRRMAWVPEQVDLKIIDHPHLTYRTGLQSVPAGMTDALTQIETLNLPRGISRRKAREAGVTASTDALRAALKLWKTPQVHPQVHSLEDLIGSPNRSTRSTGETAGQDPRSTARSTQVHPSSQVDLGPLSLERGPVQANPGPDQPFNPFD